MNDKPSACEGCVLQWSGTGFLGSVGPSRPALTFVGDFPSHSEVRSGIPLTEGGAIFNRLLSMLGRRREEFALHSVLSCVPPASPKTGRPWLLGAPYEASCVNHCRTHLDRTLGQAGPVVVALGEIAMRALLDIPRLPKATMTEMHGHVLREPHGRFWVVPTFDPRFLQRGGQNLMGVVLRDLQRALDVARTGHEPSEPDIVEDPSVEWFAQWADAYLAAVAEDPRGVWLAVDIETPHGIKGNDLPTWTIERINFSCHPDEGVTVPWNGAYIDIARRLLASPGVKVFWNWRFDVRRLEHNASPVSGRVWDALDFWHAYQSDMGGSDDDKGGSGGAATVKGNSLGFVAPFYSAAAPWKHLSDSRPSYYAGKDAAQTLRIIMGVVSDLTRDGMLHVPQIHLSLFDQYVMSPAEKVGLGVDLARLPVFTEDLKRKEAILLAEIEALAPPEVGGLHPANGWASPPDSTRTLDERGAVTGEQGAKGAVENAVSSSGRVATTLVKGIVRTAPLVNRPLVAKVKKCMTCGASSRVTAKHRCKERFVNKKGVEKERVSKTLIADVREIEELTDRFYIRLPFNPGSSQQMKRVFAVWNLPLSKGDKADKLALEGALTKCAKKEDRRLFFKCCLAWRKIAKIEGTYGTGTLKRLAAQEARGVMDGRLHPEFTNRPSTLRTSCRKPNLQNVVSR